MLLRTRGVAGHLCPLGSAHRVPDELSSAAHTSARTWLAAPDSSPRTFDNRPKCVPKRNTMACTVCQGTAGPPPTFHCSLALPPTVELHWPGFLSRPDAMQNTACSEISGHSFPGDMGGEEEGGEKRRKRRKERGRAGETEREDEGGERAERETGREAGGRQGASHPPFPNQVSWWSLPHTQVHRGKEATEERRRHPPTPFAAGFHAGWSQ